MQYVINNFLNAITLLYIEVTKSIKCYSIRKSLSCINIIDKKKKKDIKIFEIER